MDKSEELKRILEALTGQKAPESAKVPNAAVERVESEDGLGLSQFNELLLFLGFDRVCPELFQFLIDGSSVYQRGAAINGFEDLRRGVDRFRKMALLLYGNTKFAFKTFSSRPDLLHNWLDELDDVSVERFEDRHPPVMPISVIAPEDTYLMGYLVKEQIEARIVDDPNDNDAIAMQERRNQLLEVGKRNHDAYLVSDHLDVYVATSMREQHEYIFVSDIAKKIFASDELAPLQLRWFDPTQAVCEDRIDKGLAEALMLKRAKVTVYLAQESDTFGKDSELASTLAQGKPVIAYVPTGDEHFVLGMIETLKKIHPEKAEHSLMLEQLRVFDSGLAWEDPQVRGWISDPSAARLDEMRQLLFRVVKKHYEKRASLLDKNHPLGIQVNLGNGVANGVLVARTPEQCAELIKRVVTNALEFRIEETSRADSSHILLRETISGSVFRVMTGDDLLTNAFWSFYLG